ncbi:Fatty acid synthase [Camponotus floridanus]|uniref:Fatty acid synthase n=1 Tax=Camponotus floridanus TaxID=104421 RepID=E2ABR5_CAMFO|nr:Fatty acid synthase [Camponotus floridanus]
MGHSIGELVCGYADGCLMAEETIMLAYYVGLAFSESKIIGGLMAEINLDLEINLETMKNICPSDIDVACYNSSHNYIVSGPTSSVKAFLTKLQTDNISVKEIFCGHVPFHSRYVEPARDKLSEYLNQILPQIASPSSKWLNVLNESCEWFNTFPNISYLAKYYTNNLLTPVVFSEAMHFIPNDAVTIEIAPHDILQYILNDSLKATVTNVALYKFSHKPNVEIFLPGIGKHYNAGLQLQIANLYPEIKFSVSRNTPMISHLARWDHSKDWYVYHYFGQRKLDIGETIVTINLLEEEFMYMTGHVINGRNLLPATGYLFLIWQMIGWLKKQNHLDIPIVFEDVNFLRSAVLSKQNPVDLTLMIQKGSCKFEIIEGDSAVVTGTVRTPLNIEDEKICSAFIDRNDNDKEEMNIKDIYKELKLRGYQYTGEFRGLRSASIIGKNGHIAWTDNWVTFIDNMLQMMILGQNSRSLFVPTRILKVIIDPKSHIKHIEKLSNGKKQVLVQNYKHLDVLISGGIEIHGVIATVISRRQNVANPVFEEYKFVAHRDLNVISLQDAIRMSVHIALEYDLPQICYNIKVAINERFKDIPLPDNISTIEFDNLKNENCLMIMGFGILTKNRNDLYEQLLSGIMSKGFLLTLEELNAIYDYSCLDKYGLKVRGDLNTLCWMQSRISFVNSNEENLVRVVYASINFKDIMIASGRLTESITTEGNNNSLIGMEFVAEKYHSWIIPDKWTMEDAATVPSAYSTCYYALFLNGKMKKGDKVLIHSGTGGVGQAAIYLALYKGCEVFTTVGSIEKRHFIRETFPSIPEDHIGNSRDTSFEEMIIQGTRGHGVDIVLNSLAEEKLQASVRCLAKGGRFLEIGKFDMVSNSPLKIFAFSKGISFHGILLDKLLFSTKSKNKEIIWNKFTEDLKNGAIKPLCRKVFEKDEIKTAFRYMAAGKHIGKIIIKVQKDDELDAPILAHPRYYCLEHKCYIVLGGLGGFGLELIYWLILRGAKNLVLTSRTGIKNGYQQSRITLWQSHGVNVQIITAANTSKYEDCKSILQFAEEQGPVDAIFNLAVVLKDNIFKNQSPQSFEDSFMSKARTTKRMDELSRTICPHLRHFVVFSSVSCGRGNAGQTNYGMASSVMERICEKRMSEGLHGLAIQWGAIGDVGLVADMQEDDKELVISGTLQQ